MTGEQFREWMHRNNLKPEEVALSLGVTSFAIIKWYRRKQISLMNILALKQAGYLIEETPDEETKRDGLSEKPYTQRKKMR